MYRRRPQLEFLLVHPGGPFWAKKDLGSWSIPKGEFSYPEEPLTAAKREFFEETGLELSGEFTPLVPQILKSKKTIYAWAHEGDFDPNKLKSNFFRLGNKEYPEIDRAGWFLLPEALEKIHLGQRDLLTQVV